MKDHIDKIEWIVSQFDYHELTAEDKKLVHDHIGSEDAYNLLRASILQSAVSRNSLSVSSESKKHLMRHFKNKHRKSTLPLWSLFNRKIPAYYSLIIFVLGTVFTYFTFNSYSEIDDKLGSPVSYTRAPVARDTVYIQMPGDTVFRNQIVYQKVYLPSDTIYQTVNVVAKDNSKETPIFTSDVSTSIADHQALNDLMISID